MVDPNNFSEPIESSGDEQSLLDNFGGGTDTKPQQDGAVKATT